MKHICLKKLNIQYLSNDILFIIFTNLNIKELLILSETNTFFMNLVNKNNVWKNIYLTSIFKKYIITEKSIHIDAPSFNPILYLYEIKNKQKFQIKNWTHHTRYPIIENYNKIIKCCNNPKKKKTQLSY